MKNTTATYQPGAAIRFFSVCGPCIPATVVKPNRTTYTLAFYGKIAMNMVHTEPCPSCQDHEHSQYRDGYMD